MRMGHHARAILAVSHAVARHLAIELTLVQAAHDLRDDLGLDAFDLTFIVLRLEEQLAIEVPLPAVDGAASVADLAVMIANIAADAKPAAEPVRRSIVRRSSGFRALHLPKDLAHARVGK